MEILRVAGVINDIDYCHLDPEDFVYGVISETLPLCGHDASDAAYFVKMSKIGEPFINTWTRKYGREGYEDFNAKYKRLEPKYRHLLRRIDGVYEALENLRDRGFKLAALANKQNFALNNSLIVTGLDQFFPEYLRIGINDGYEPKPSGEAITVLAERMNVEIADLVMIGDTTIDMEAALQTDAKAVGVLTGGTTREDFEKYGDQVLVLNSFAELPQVVERI